MDKNKHKIYMGQILGMIFRDDVLSKNLAFKGGTSLMFFHNLNRFSTDLDFNLLESDKLDTVYDKVKEILMRFGKIDDEAKKHYGPVLVLNYGRGERMLKVEISTRQYPNHYEMRSLGGTDIRVMTMPDMFAHKLCAMGERLSPRDIFDVYFFLQNHTEINEEIVKIRKGKSVAEYAAWCSKRVREASPKLLMQGLGEVLEDAKIKSFVRDKLITETSSALDLFSAFPLVAKQNNIEGNEVIEDFEEDIEEEEDQTRSRGFHR